MVSVCVVCVAEVAVMVAVVTVVVVAVFVTVVSVTVVAVKGVVTIVAEAVVSVIVSVVVVNVVLGHVPQVTAHCDFATAELEHALSATYEAHVAWSKMSPCSQSIICSTQLCSEFDFYQTTISSHFFNGAKIHIVVALVALPVVNAHAISPDFQTTSSCIVAT